MEFEIDPDVKQARFDIDSSGNFMEIEPVPVLKTEPTIEVQHFDKDRIPKI